MSILSPSSLETFDYGTPGWNYIYSSNMDRLENALLKLKALQDVDLDSIGDQKPFKWNASTQKWEPYTP